MASSNDLFCHSMSCPVFSPTISPPPRHYIHNMVCMCVCMNENNQEDANN